MKEFILLCIAIVLAAVLLPIGFFVQIIFGFWNIKAYFYKVALSIDQLGNVVCQNLFNCTLIIWSSPHRFGHEDETISSVLGKNEKEKTLSVLGKALCFLLNSIDKEHTYKSIDK
jgi:8-oxo-dGTP diphosphatase